jgi:hypothetical protein
MLSFYSLLEAAVAEAEKILMLKAVAEAEEALVVCYIQQEAHPLEAFQ